MKAAEGRVAQAKNLGDQRALLDPQLALATPCACVCVCLLSVTVHLFRKHIRKMLLKSSRKPLFCRELGQSRVW